MFARIPPSSLQCNQDIMVVSGPLTTISCEPRQVRKEAAVAVISGVEVWLLTTASFLHQMDECRELLSISS